jgi:hypothetical protein
MLSKKLGIITFSPQELPAYVILPPRTTTSTKKEHQTTIFTYFAPFRQSNSCKYLNALTQFQKLPKYHHFFKKKKKETEGKRVAPATSVGGSQATRPPQGWLLPPLFFQFLF